MRSRTWSISARSRGTGLHEPSPNWLWGSTELELAWGEAVGAAGPPHLLAQRLPGPPPESEPGVVAVVRAAVRQLLTLAKKSEAIP